MFYVPALILRKYRNDALRINIRFPVITSVHCAFNTRRTNKGLKSLPFTDFGRASRRGTIKLHFFKGTRVCETRRKERKRERKREKEREMFIRTRLSATRRQNASA